MNTARTKIQHLNDYDHCAVESILELSRVDDSTGCWVWEGYRSPTGYGTVGYKGRKAYTHRLMYVLFVGPIPEGTQLDHFRCDNRSCCNPDHVRPVSPRENTLRSSNPAALNAAKTHCVRGHEFTDATTYVTRAGKRQCRVCMLIRQRAAYARIKQNRTGTETKPGPS